MEGVFTHWVKHFFVIFRMGLKVRVLYEAVPLLSSAFQKQKVVVSYYASGGMLWP